MTAFTSTFCSCLSSLRAIHLCTQLIEIRVVIRVNGHLILEISIGAFHLGVYFTLGRLSTVQLQLNHRTFICQV